MVFFLASIRLYPNLFNMDNITDKIDNCEYFLLFV